MPSKHRLCLTRSQLTWPSPPDLLRVDGRTANLLHARLNLPGPTWRCSCVRPWSCGGVTSSRAHSAKVARTTLECAQSSPHQHAQRPCSILAAHQRSHPQLSPQPLHHHTCAQALKHGCANRDLRGLRHGGSSTSWDCDPSQRFSLDVASWNAVRRGAWLRSLRRRYSRGHDMKAANQRAVPGIQSGYQRGASLVSCSLSQPLRCAG